MELQTDYKYGNEFQGILAGMSGLNIMSQTKLPLVADNNNNNNNNNENNNNDNNNNKNNNKNTLSPVYTPSQQESTRTNPASEGMRTMTLYTEEGSNNDQGHQSKFSTQISKPKLPLVNHSFLLSKWEVCQIHRR